MKKFKIFSLLATILLCSFFVYSCMKEVSTQLPELETLQVQSSTTNNIKKEALNKLFTQALNHVSADEPLSSIDNECSTPSDELSCKTYDFTFPDNVTIDMPPTTLNPLQTVAILRFTMTVCFGSNGQVTISYRNVEASNKNFFQLMPC